MTPSPPPRIDGIPGLPQPASAAVLETLQRCPRVEQVWLYGSRAMGHPRPGSDIDLTLMGASLSHRDRLELMAAIDALLLPWQVDLSLFAELPPDLKGHVGRVGIRLL